MQHILSNIPKGPWGKVSDPSLRFLRRMRPAHLGRQRQVKLSATPRRFVLFLLGLVLFLRHRLQYVHDLIRFKLRHICADDGDADLCEFG